MATKQTVTPQEIEKIARLAKLHLSADQRDVYTGQINAILEHVQTLEAVDVSDVEPLSHVLDLANVSRSDQAAPSLPREAVLANVPVIASKGASRERATDGEFILVPVVLKTGP